MSENQVSAQTLLALLEGAIFANALRQNGRPCPIRLPDEREARSALVIAHLRGEPATLTFHAEGRDPWNEQVEAVVLAAFCPAADGLCRWVGIDLDASDHGERGLADPVHVTRTIAERADAAGLWSGLLVARSRRGRGRHVFLLLPEPIPLVDAVVGVAALAAAAFKVADSDMENYTAPHAFRRADGRIARSGDVGAVELVPYSTEKPRYGWAMTLPCSGVFAAHGGGIIVNPFDDKKVVLDDVPRCDETAWSRFIDEAQLRIAAHNGSVISRSGKQRSICTHKGLASIDRIDPRTRAFIDGRILEGGRNRSAFAASANLLGSGVDPQEAEQLILAGASACGLPEREVRAVFKSAEQAIARRQGHG